MCETMRTGNEVVLSILVPRGTRKAECHGDRPSIQCVNIARMDLIRTNYASDSNRITFFINGTEFRPIIRAIDPRN